jgi:hypothetical protein
VVAETASARNLPSRISGSDAPATVYDSAIYSAGSISSGHTLKPVAAAAACLAILKFQQHS